ncbi:Golgi apparatus membrane protein TVP23 [Neolentinus lepideus HHB14362 ss-1]|uniref:Golgi apparatus membrane protein TVP23 n=1 Tax=Neolentinus lepideus HHB14362 ss-1 TaxID=1314782 RepID=A0A165PXY2_9AGAM|nr:Golgi apparatus membrane protein TVP23 [Neolentinus lepideus HHB14362 ss-1]
MSTATQPLLDTIEPDEETSAPSQAPAGNANANARQPVVLTPTNRADGVATNPGDVESGLAGIFRQSAHPVVLFFLYLFRSAAIAVYILCGFFTDNYVLSTVFVVLLLAMDFWNCRNVAGRRLVGLRYWNQVDDDGESYWVFESRDPSRPANPIDSKMFWIALYAFPALWLALFIVSLLKFNISFIPIVVLALVFNVTNVVGFTYADRDAKARWANAAASGWTMGMGGLGGQILSGVVKNSVGRVFR